MLFQKILIVLMVVWVGSFRGPITARAEAPSEKHAFDLFACIQQALRANPRMAEARLAVEQADIQLKSAKYSRTPKIELFNRTGVAKDAIGDGVTGEELDNELGPFNRINVLFTLPLYTFGRITNSINAASENVGRQKASQFKTTSDLILGVHKRYYGYVVARQLLKTVKNVQKNFTEAYEVAEERLDEGDSQVSETDALKLKVGLAVVTSNVYRVRREVRVSRAGLREIMGLDDRIDFDVVDKKLKIVDFKLQSLEFYIEKAMEDNPDIGQLRAAVSAEEAQYHAERSRYYPVFLALGGVRHGVAPGRDDQNNPYLNDEYNFFDAGVSLGVKWNLDFWNTNNDVDERKIRYLKMQSRLEKVLDSITLQVKDRYHRYTERKNNLDASFEGKKAGRALLFLNLTSFKLGMGSGKDVFDALSLHARVDGDYYRAIFEYNMAVVELLNAIGSLHPELFLRAQAG
jgi:outer membrane protein TolC